jgi:hypothetical protein
MSVTRQIDHVVQGLPRHVQTAIQLQNFKTVDDVISTAQIVLQKTARIEATEAYRLLQPAVASIQDPQPLQTQMAELTTAICKLTEMVDQKQIQQSQPDTVGAVTQPDPSRVSNLPFRGQQRGRGQRGRGRGRRSNNNNWNNNSGQNYENNWNNNSGQNYNNNWNNNSGQNYNNNWNNNSGQNYNNNWNNNSGQNYNNNWNNNGNYQQNRGNPNNYRSGHGGRNRGNTQRRNQPLFTFDQVQALLATSTGTNGAGNQQRASFPQMNQVNTVFNPLVCAHCGGQGHDVTTCSQIF